MRVEARLPVDWGLLASEGCDMEGNVERQGNSEGVAVFIGKKATKSRS